MTRGDGNVVTKFERPEQNLDLGEVLRELGHTPESFARVIDRNPSGFRRIVRGETTMLPPSTVREIIDGLFAEGFQGDPRTIKQLGAMGWREGARVLRARTVHQRGVIAGRQTVLPDTPVSEALASLMQALGRKEVDRVYRRVFGTRPDEKE